MPPLATCPACNKRYNVPHTKKTWHCKVCEGVLDVEDEAEVAATCGECEAELEAGAEFCADCGAPVDGGAPGADRNSKQSKRKKAELVRALRAAQKPLQIVRLFIGVGFFFQVLALTFWLLVIFAASSDDSLEGAKTLIFVFTGGIVFEIVLMGLVLKNLKHRPFPAALALALWRTLFLALGFFVSDGDGVSIWAIGLTIFYWFVVSKVAVVSRLVRDNPDLYISRRAAGESRVSEGRGHRIRDRSLGRAKQGQRRKRIFGGIFLGIVAVAGIAAYGVHLSKQPSSPDAEIAEFQEAWNRKDIDVLAGFGAKDQFDKWSRTFGKLDRIYDWGTEWPQASGANFEWTDGRVTAELETEAGALPFKMSWRDGSRWVLHHLDTSEVKSWKK